MTNLSAKKILILKYILVFIAVLILTYSLLMIVKYKVFKPSENENGIISLQHLAKRGSSDTSPDKSTSAEKNKISNDEKAPADSGS